MEKLVYKLDPRGKATHLNQGLLRKNEKAPADPPRIRPRMYKPTGPVVRIRLHYGGSEIDCSTEMAEDLIARGKATRV